MWVNGAKILAWTRRRAVDRIVRGESQAKRVQDVPSDVRAVVTQLLDESQRALAAGDYGTVRESVATVDSVATNKLPESELRAEMRHGCHRVEVLLDPDDGVQSDTATEYLAAMERRFTAAAG